MRIEQPASDYLSSIGRKGGSVKSTRKAEQARINGARNTGKKKMKIVVDQPKPLGYIASKK